VSVSFTHLVYVSLFPPFYSSSATGGARFSTTVASIIPWQTRCGGREGGRAGGREGRNEEMEGWTDASKSINACFISLPPSFPRQVPPELAGLNAAYETVLASGVVNNVVGTCLPSLPPFFPPSLPLLLSHTLPFLLSFFFFCVGRARAWLRLCLNMKCLESSLRALITQHNHLLQVYRKRGREGKEAYFCVNDHRVPRSSSRKCLSIFFPPPLPPSRPPSLPLF